MKLAVLALAVVGFAAAAPTPPPKLQTPIFHPAGSCAAHCSIPALARAHSSVQLKDVVCSHEGRRHMYECAKCIDATFKDGADPEQYAMAEYARVLRACDSELFNE